MNDEATAQVQQDDSQLEDENVGLMGNPETTATADKDEAAEESIPHLQQVKPPAEETHDGSRTRPDYIPEKFWNETEGKIEEESVFKSIQELEKKLGQGQHKVPDQYDLSTLRDANIADDDPMLGDFTKIAKKYGLNQAAFNEVVGIVTTRAVEQQGNEIDHKAEMAALGPNGQQIIDANKAWTASLVSKGIITEDEQKELYVLGDVAAGQRVLSKIRRLTGDMTPIPTSAQPIAKMSEEDFKMEIQEDMKDPRYGKDKVYTASIEKKFQEFYGE